MQTMRYAAAGIAAAILLTLGTGTAFAALQPGEYACYGSGGRILIGLGFKVLGGDVYTDLDAKSRGQLSYGNGGSSVRFIGGHLAGQVGRNVRGRSLSIRSTSCQLWK